MILMRILIYGAGVIGSLYAALFAEAGYDTGCGSKVKQLKSKEKALEILQKKREVLFLSIDGNHWDSLHSIWEKEMQEASKMLEFEYAAILRDRIIELRKEEKK